MIETLDQIMENLKKNPEHYNTGASSKPEYFERFDRDD